MRSHPSPTSHAVLSGPYNYHNAVSPPFSYHTPGNLSIPVLISPHFRTILNLNTVDIESQSQQEGSLCPWGVAGCYYIPHTRAEKALQNSTKPGNATFPPACTFRPLGYSSRMNPRPRVTPLSQPAPPTIYFVRDSSKK